MRKKLEPRLKSRQACARDVRILAKLRAFASADQLTVRENGVDYYGRKTLHVMIDDAVTGQRLIDYWPGSGLTIACDGARRKVPDLDEAYTAALEIVKRQTRFKPVQPGG